MINKLKYLKIRKKNRKKFKFVFTMMKQQMSNAKMLQIKKKLIYSQSAMKNLFAENVAYLTKKYVDLIHVNLLVVILIKNIFVINVSIIFYVKLVQKMIDVFAIEIVFNIVIKVKKIVKSKVKRNKNKRKVKKKEMMRNKHKWKKIDLNDIVK